MKAVRRLFRRVTSWVTSARDEERLRAEFEEHIAMQTAENLRAGLRFVAERNRSLATDRTRFRLAAAKAGQIRNRRRSRNDRLTGTDARLRNRLFFGFLSRENRQ